MENIGDAWHRATAERVGKAVAKFRKDAGMTAQQLAERCKELDAPIHRTTITKIEGGRSRFDLGELLILAAALDVPPLALLFPDLPDGPVEVVPGHTLSSLDAYLWTTGMRPGRNGTSAGSRLVSAVLERDKEMKTAAHAFTEVGLYAKADPTRSKAMKLLLDRARANILRLEHEIRDCGGVLDDA